MPMFCPIILQLFWISGFSHSQCNFRFKTHQFRWISIVWHFGCAKVYKKQQNMSRFRGKSFVHSAFENHMFCLQMIRHETYHTLVKKNHFSSNACVVLASSSTVFNTIIYVHHIQFICIRIKRQIKVLNYAKYCTLQNGQKMQK